MKIERMLKFLFCSKKEIVNVELTCVFNLNQEGRKIISAKF